MSEKSPKHKSDPLVDIRNGVLHELWHRVFQEGGFRGRTWGKRGKEIQTVYEGSHILIGSSTGEIVIVNIVDGVPTVHEFIATYGTDLGDEVRRLLEEG